MCVAFAYVLPRFQTDPLFGVYVGMGDYGSACGKLNTSSPTEPVFYLLTRPSNLEELGGSCESNGGSSDASDTDGIPAIWASWSESQPKRYLTTGNAHAVDQVIESLSNALMEDSRVFRVTDEDFMFRYSRQRKVLCHPSLLD